MFPRITDLFNYLFGTSWSFPVQTYGFFVAMAFLTAAWVLRNEMKRREKLGQFQPLKKRILKGAPASMWELIINGIAGFVVGYKFIGIVIDYSEFDSDPQAYFFSAQGSIIGAIAVATIMIFSRYRSKKKQQLEKPVWEEITIPAHQMAGNILIIAAVSGLFGAKIFHNLENFHELVEDPVGSLFSFMGLTFYGGLIVGSLTVAWYLRRKKMSLVHVLDSAAPAIMLGYGIGRLGCMLSGDGCWGMVNPHPKPGWMSFLPDWMWSFSFPHNVVNEGIPIDHCTGKFCTILEHPVYPTSLYDFMLCLIFFGVLMAIRKRIQLPGLLFSLFLLITGIQRMFMEQIRVNTKYHIGSFEITQAEIISFVLILSGIGLGIFFYKRSKKDKRLKN
jgi:phosphatidylglycerol---prolipoprotein diacylglyceryl transferase